MITLIKNKYNLKEKDITDKTTKIKVFLKNKDILYIGYARDNYQLPGGTHEEGETLSDTLIREIKEEVGIELNKENYKPFLLLKSYYKNWPSDNRNKLVEIYYFEVETNKKPNINNINLTQNEKEKDFKILEVPFNNIKELLEENLSLYEDKQGITKELLEIIEYM